MTTNLRSKIECAALARAHDSQPTVWNFNVTGNSCAVYEVLRLVLAHAAGPNIDGYHPMNMTPVVLQGSHLIIIVNVHVVQLLDAKTDSDPAVTVRLLN